jgi:hypothetical protein
MEVSLERKKFSYWGRGGEALQTEIDSERVKLIKENYRRKKRMVKNYHRNGHTAWREKGEAMLAMSVSL